MTSHPSTPAPASGLRAALEQIKSRPYPATSDQNVVEHYNALLKDWHDMKRFVSSTLASIPAPEDKPEPDVVAGRCAKPGCGAQRRIGKPCTDWDCPQATLTAQEHRAALQAERRKREEAEAERDALNAKLHALAPHGTCACAWDSPDDLCLHHSPKLAAAEATIATLTATIAELRAALHDLLSRPTDPAARQRARSTLAQVTKEGSSHG